jgi:HAD superfamily hydrolase (TIGR01484 family)
MHLATAPRPSAATRTWPRPLSALPAGAWRGIAGVLTDIDDTLTRDGVIEAAALQALHRLHAATLPVVAVTGRSLGWCRQHTARWPVAAVVAEGGAVALRRDGDGWATEYLHDAATRARQARQLAAVAALVVARVPGAALARDSAGRETDIAIDHAEHTPLGAEAVSQVVALMRAEGLNCSVSSIHVNGWIGGHNKASGAGWMLQRLWGRRLEDEVERWLCVGDSPNDEALFALLPHSVGVANLRPFVPQLRHPPAWLAEGERGTGFAEVARLLLAQQGLQA